MSYTGMTCGHAGRLCDVLPRGHPLRVHETANRTRLQTGRDCKQDGGARLPARRECLRGWFVWRWRACVWRLVFFILPDLRERLGCGCWSCAFCYTFFGYDLVHSVKRRRRRPSPTHPICRALASRATRGTAWTLDRRLALPAARPPILSRCSIRSPHPTRVHQRVHHCSTRQSYARVLFEWKQRCQHCHPQQL